jgi:isopenicillin N synthase-like dioxygenase
MLSRLTGGRLPATTHRVVADAATATRSRTAYPFFAHPRPECDLGVRSEFIPPGATAPFEPITAGEFLAQRLLEIGLVEGDGDA